MPECCQPVQCRFIDGLLSFFLVCGMIGSTVLLLNLYIDDNFSQGHCIILNLTTNYIELPSQFDSIVCDNIKYVVSSQILVPLILAVISSILGLSSYTWWSVFRTLVILLETLIALTVAIVFTVSLFIFCGQLYRITKNSYCFQAAKIYDDIFPDKEMHPGKIELTFEHVVTAVASSWLIFFSFTFATIVLIVKSCTKYYEKRVNTLEQTLEDTRLALLIESSQQREQQQRSAPYDPPPAYNSNNYQEQAGPTEQTPLIQF